ncbi:MAG: hypothetical protein ACLFNK_01930 [Candidatus Woesearchaeota archaeon]
MRSNKAQGMSFNFIVMIAIALIVMFVVIGIFTSRTNEGNQNLQSCEARGGVCVGTEGNHPDICKDSYDTNYENGDKSTGKPIFGAHCFSDGEKDDRSCCIREKD